MSVLTAPRRGIIGLDRLVRLHFFGATLMIGLLGAASVAPLALDARLGGLILVCFFVHVFGYVLNDVIDLPVDRLEPSRAMDPLVRGVIRPWQALAVAFAQLPLALGVTALLDGGAYAYGSLAVGFVMLMVYDVWGKRFVVPPVTDAAQGIAWGSLAFYGAALMGSPNFLTVVVGGYMAGFILLINGVHGGLRDLENDRSCGRRTTSIFFGVRARPDGSFEVPASIRWFSASVQLGLIALIGAPLLRNDFGYGPLVLIVTSAVVGALCAINFFLVLEVLKPAKSSWPTTFRAHLVLILFTLIIAFIGHLSPWMRLLVVVEFFAPLFLIEKMREFFFGARAEIQAPAISS
jgi:4-hydroxybenzoate polyprenyltransferase